MKKIRLSAALSNQLQKINKKTAIIGAVIVLALGVFSVLLTLLLGGNFRIYAYLRKPPFAPPRFLFSLIWTLLFLLIGGAAGAVYGAKSCRDGDKYRGLFLFAVMMAFLIAWCPLFFAGDAYFLALIDIAILFLLNAFTARYFAMTLKAAGWALLLFGLWLIYAFILNFTILLLN